MFYWTYLNWMDMSGIEYTISGQKKTKGMWCTLRFGIDSFPGKQMERRLIDIWEAMC